MNILQRILLVLALGFILYFFSERVFWSFWKPDETFGGTILGVIFYSLVAYAIILIISYFKVNNIYSIFITGAIFGWLDEGLLTTTLYGIEGSPFPASISWTGLAWHALISFTIGFYLIKLYINKNQKTKLVLLSIFIGLFWALWSIFWKSEDPSLNIPFDGFLIHAFVSSLLLIISFIYFNKSIKEFNPRLAEKIIIPLLLVIYFITVTYPTNPTSIVILPILLVLAFLILYKNKKMESDNIFANKTSNNYFNYIILIIIPIVASASYYLIYNLKIVFQSNLIVYYVTMPLGFIAFIYSTIKIFNKSTYENKKIIKSRN
ncbi:hypothetical protein J4471_00710 [Candidatus Woesearchaeota archaeon]|nr:hypothetical protein [Candidatus Woesearchaeota archaeon]